jgi:hypothetical protein
MNALLAVVGFFVIVYLMSWYFNGSKTLSSYADAKTELTIPYTEIPLSNTNNYSYSIWIYIDDWGYRYGDEKIIFLRGTIGSVFMPALTLAPMDNRLRVTVSTNSQPFMATVPNMPLQKWTNIIVSLNNKVLDIYLNGKLVKTSILPDFPKIDQNAGVFLTPAGGFSGFTSRFNYWANYMNPQDAWNTYKEGPGGNIFSNFFNQYKIKLSFIKGTDEKASVTI